MDNRNCFKTLNSITRSAFKLLNDKVTVRFGGGGGVSRSNV